MPSNAEQTRYFMETALAHLPEPEKAYLSGNPLTILDWGCAFGEGVAALARAFPRSQVAGLDFSKEAIDEAGVRHAGHEFIWSEDGAIPRDFDCIVTANCLQNFEQPLAWMERHAAACRSLYIALVPYNECPLLPQHRSQFRVESFPEAVQNFKRIHAEPLGEQMLVVYGSESYLQKAVQRRDSMAFAIARLVAAQLADRQIAASVEEVRRRALTAEAERDVERRKTVTAQAERDAQRQRADRAEATLATERERLERLLQIERWTSAELRDRTMKGLECFQAEFEKRLSSYRSERAWRVMLGIRKAYTMLVRGKLERTTLDDFEPVFPDLASFIPVELSARTYTSPAAPVAASVEDPPAPALVDPAADILSRAHPTDLILSFFALMSQEAPDAKEVWKTFHTVFRGAYEEFSTALGQNMEAGEVVDLLELFLIQVVRNGVLAPERSERMFQAGQALGVHLLPVHFYTPIPNTSAIAESVWSERSDRGGAWKLDARSQLALIDELARFAPELEAIPEEKDGSGFYWNNPAFCAADAAVYYCMIRHFRPALILEAGAGYSTLIAAAACARNGDTVLEAIDPFPSPLVTAALPGLTGLVTAPLQAIQLAPFQALGENDILFIDSTHVSKVGSDVNYLILSVLPSLNKGVLIHIHDIFLPWNYPRRWVLEKNIFWNEQYLLLAFLLFNNQFEVVLANHYLGREHPSRLVYAFPFVKGKMGCSIWLRRK